MPDAAFPHFTRAPVVNARLIAVWDDLRSSYWFIPSLMAFTAFVLSFVLVYIDGVVGSNWIDGVPWLYANKPDGARQLLTTVAGSMIGVAGVTFSITIASVVFASGQYGPRLLTNFMGDRGNQVSLGTFIATFLYCLLVLRTIRAADEGFGGANPAGDAVGAFVPHVALLAALIFALCSIGVLIYFIHHVPESIHVSNVIAGIGRELQHKVNELFPTAVGQARDIEERDIHASATDSLPVGFLHRAVGIQANDSGYVQGIDGRMLMDIATENDLVLHVRFRPGDFVSIEDALVHAAPSDADVPTDLSDEARSAILKAFVYGPHRTARQDARFLVNELVEIAARALSPGVNDPFTAMSCLDWLSAGLKGLAGREVPTGARCDQDGTLRVVVTPTTFDELVRHVYAQLRPYLAADRNAALYALQTIGDIVERVEEEPGRLALRAEADALLQGVEAVLLIEADLVAVRERHRQTIRLVSGQPSDADIVRDTNWIGETA